MVQKLTKKQNIFITAFIETGNASEAYRRAYNCARMKPSTVRYRARDLLALGHIKATVEALQVEEQRRLQRKYQVDNDRIMRELVRIAFFDIRKIFDDHDRLKPITELDDDTARALAEVVVRERVDGETLVRTSKFKSIDKLAALKEISRMLGLYAEDNKQKAGEKKTEVTVNLFDRLGQLYPDPEKEIQEIER